MFFKASVLTYQEAMAEAERGREMVNARPAGCPVTVSVLLPRGFQGSDFESQAL